MKKRRQVTADQRAGCDVCDGVGFASHFNSGATPWARSHHKKTGHPTWVQSVTTRWYEDEPDQEAK